MSGGGIVPAVVSPNSPRCCINLAETLGPAWARRTWKKEVLERPAVPSAPGTFRRLLPSPEAAFTCEGARRRPSSD